MHAESETGKLGALRLMLDTTKNLVDLLGISSLTQEQLNREHAEHAEAMIHLLHEIEIKAEASGFLALWL
jgi:hypothetical protein